MRKTTTKHQISVFKIRIDSIKPHAIGFELFAGEKVKDTYVNIVAKGGYGYESRLLLTPKQFSDFAIRLIAYVYMEKTGSFTDEALSILWNLKLNIFNHENQNMSVPIFEIYKDRLNNLELMKGKNDR